MEPRPTVRRSHRRRRDARSPLLIGLVLVLLATVPVLVPLLVTRGGSTATVAPPGLAAQPGVPALPRSGEGAEPSGATGTTGTSADAAAPPPAGALAGIPTPTTTPPSSSPPPAPAPEPTAPSSTAPSTSDPPPVSLAAEPDLVVVSVAWSPAQPATGQPVTFTAVVRNAGSEPTPEVTHGVGFAVDGEAVSWSSAQSAPLAPGEERTYTADGGVGGAAWTATPGEHELEASVDDVDRIGETDNANNSLSASFTIE